MKRPEECRQLLVSKQQKQQQQQQRTNEVNVGKIAPYSEFATKLPSCEEAVSPISYAATAAAPPQRIQTQS